MSSNITIRQAGAGDAGIIHAMVQALARDLDHVGDVKSSAEDQARFGPAGSAVFDALIAEQGGQPVGLCIYFLTYSSWRGRPGVFVLDLYVAPQARAQGLGRRLLANAAQRGRAQGADYLHLAVHDSNPQARAFYDRLGFCAVRDEEVLMIRDAGFEKLATP